MKTKLIVSLILSIILISTVSSCKSEKNSVKLTKNNYPERVKKSVIYEVNIRQYTPEGTFVAFEKQLPRLQKLGVDILWLMPIFPVGEKNRKGSLGSYYSIKNYTETNPEFGTKKDLKKLVDDAHSKGMLVILDWVANHTSFDNPWIKEHPDWYNHDSLGNIISPVPDWSDVADLNYNNKNMRNAMVDAMKYWVKDFDIDGFRCDVAFMVPTDFWDSARVELDKLKPMFMLAEAEKPALMTKAFDMYYSWNLYHLMNDIASGKKHASEIIKYIREDSTKFPKRSFRMTFTSNHDENSWNGTVYERMPDSYKTFAVLTYVLPGMPLIYSGQEACLNKRLKFFDKDTIDWKNCDMTSLYQKLDNLKHSHSALYNFSFASKMIPIETSDDTNILAFVRKNADDEVLCLFNLSKNPANIQIFDKEFNSQYTDFFSNKKIDLSSLKSIYLKPWEYKILIK